MARRSPRGAPWTGVGLREFILEDQLPLWRYGINDAAWEKRVVMPHLQNTVMLRYELTAGSPCKLRLRPWIHFRPIEGMPALVAPGDYAAEPRGRTGFVVKSADGLELRMYEEAGGGQFELRPETKPWAYILDSLRGLPSQGEIWSPGVFEIPLQPNQPVAIIASTESWETARALTSEQAWHAECSRRQRLKSQAVLAADDGLAGELVLAADSFIILPGSRLREAAQAHALGEESRSVIAGYHWFTDWGRDTMISLEGLALVTGRYKEAAWILRTFSRHVRHGLIPNLFPEGKNEGLYHTADATLWFFHALDRYTEVTGDFELVAEVLPVLSEIIAAHIRGTRFGIRMDADDCLLTQGEQGYALTWMDAKMDGWVVTPRRGKAVEINALWYNALRLLDGWLQRAESEQSTLSLGRIADTVAASFNERFWNSSRGCLFDVIDGERGNDDAVRPNQIFALALRHPVLQRDRWEAVVGVVERELLTPVGLRSLAPSHREYQANYRGDLRQRDGAYHQGTVWAWLIGPFLNAWLRCHGDVARARSFLDGFSHHMNEGCIGSISEIFDAEAPFTQRGCIAQAWSVAEVLRALAMTKPTKGGAGA